MIIIYLLQEINKRLERIEDARRAQVGNQRKFLYRFIFFLLVDKTIAMFSNSILHNPVIITANGNCNYHNHSSQTRKFYFLLIVNLHLTMQFFDHSYLY